MPDPCRPRARPSSNLLPEHRDLLVGGADRDDPVGELAGLLGVDRPGGRDVDRARGALGERVELGALEREVLALVLDDVAGEQLVDDLDRLEHHRAADADLRPVAADDVLVERLARAEPEPEAAREHGPERRGRVGDDRRVVAEARAGHAGPEGEAGPRAERAHERPGEGALALLRRPRVEVLADHEPGLEAGVLGRRAPVEQVGRMELLEHRGVADLVVTGLSGGQRQGACVTSQRRSGRIDAGHPDRRRRRRLRAGRRRRLDAIRPSAAARRRHRCADALSRGADRGPSDGREQVCVPAGGVPMGRRTPADIRTSSYRRWSPPDWVAVALPSEQPAHDVTLTRATGSIDRGHQRGVRGLHGRRRLHDRGALVARGLGLAGHGRGRPAEAVRGRRPRRPGCCVTWFEAEAYAAGAAAGSRPRRNGSTRPAAPSRGLPVGRRLDPARRTSSTARRRQPSGAIRRRAGSAPDMAGNAMEWVADWLDAAIRDAPATDPTGPATARSRSRRAAGGAATRSSPGRPIATTRIRRPTATSTSASGVSASWAVSRSVDGATARPSRPTSPTTRTASGPSPRPADAARSRPSRPQPGGTSPGARSASGASTNSRSRGVAMRDLEQPRPRPGSRRRRRIAPRAAARRRAGRGRTRAGRGRARAAPSAARCCRPNARSSSLSGARSASARRSPGRGPPGTSSATTALRKSGWSVTPHRRRRVQPRDAPQRAHRAGPRARGPPRPASPRRRRRWRRGRCTRGPVERPRSPPAVAARLAAPCDPVTVRILHPEPGPAAGPLERWVAAARAALAERHAAGFAAAGADRRPGRQRAARRYTVRRAGSGDLVRAERPGRARRPGLRRDPAGDRGATGATSSPPPRADDRRALANNRYSADVVAIARATEALADLPGPRRRQRAAALAGRGRRAIAVDDLRRRWRLGDRHRRPARRRPARPTWRRPSPSASRRAARARAPRRRSAAVAADPRAELVVAGRTSAATLAGSSAHTASRTRALVEERGLRDASPAPASARRASVLGAAPRSGRARARSATHPRAGSATRRSSTRGSCWPTGSARTRRPGQRPRTASPPTSCCPTGRATRGCATLTARGRRRADPGRCSAATPWSARALRLVVGPRATRRPDAMDLDARPPPRPGTRPRRGRRGRGARRADPRRDRARRPDHRSPGSWSSRCTTRTAATTAAARPRPGRAGDFLTAPETHPIFGGALARPARRGLATPRRAAPVRRSASTAPGPARSRWPSSTASSDAIGRCATAIALRAGRGRARAGSTPSRARLAAAGLDGPARRTATGRGGPSTASSSPTRSSTRCPSTASPARRRRSREICVGRGRTAPSSTSRSSRRRRRSPPASRTRASTLAEGQTRGDLPRGRRLGRRGRRPACERGLLLLIDYGHPAAELYDPRPTARRHAAGVRPPARPRRSVSRTSAGRT